MSIRLPKYPSQTAYMRLSCPYVTLAGPLHSDLDRLSRPQGAAVFSAEINHRLGIFDTRLDPILSKAPQSNGRGAMGSKNPLHIRTLVFLCSAWF